MGQLGRLVLIIAAFKVSARALPELGRLPFRSFWSHADRPANASRIMSAHGGSPPDLLPEDRRWPRRESAICAAAMTYWEFKGRELVNCTCEYGCNCQFNALPDKGHCHAVAGIQIDEGQHGDTAPRRAKDRSDLQMAGTEFTRAMARRSRSSTARRRCASAMPC
jgi:hypothetical protein